MLYSKAGRILQYAAQISVRANGVAEDVYSNRGILWKYGIFSKFTLNTALHPRL